MAISYPFLIMAEQPQDSFEQLPNSSGFQRPGVRFAEEQRRKQYRYVAAIAKLVLERHPSIEEANNATARLTKELTALRLEVARLQSAVSDLTDLTEDHRQEVVKLTEQGRNYQQWENEIHHHVASIDAKAEDISDLSEDLDTLVRLLNTIVPPLEWLARGAMRWTKTLRQLRRQRVSRVDGEEIGGLVD